jgi:hypothetical protein
MQWTELVVFTVLFLLVTVLGFFAAKWKQGSTLDHLDEWGLGGRKFGSWITWFLVGGDLYTAYTFVAVPALMFGAGAMGFFALPYTVILYPIVFLPLVRMWSVSRVHGYVTPADFVRGRYGSHWLALLVAITGIVATMPYIALHDGPQRRGHPRPPAAVHRLRGAGALHLPVRPARARVDRVRQGRPDLPGDHRRGGLPAQQVRRLGRCLLRRAGQVRRHARAG